MTIPQLRELDLLWLRDRAIGSTNVSISIADARLPDLPIVDVNPSFERLTGYTLDEIKGRNCRFLQGPRTDSNVVDAIHRAISGEQIISTVLLNYRKDGTTFWNEVHISPVRDRSRDLTHFVGVQHDVTVRERTSQQLGLLASLSETVGRAVQPEESARSIARAFVPALADLCTVHLAGDDGVSRWIATYGVDQALVDLTTELESTLLVSNNGDQHSAVGPASPLKPPSLYPEPSAKMMQAIAIDDRHRAKLSEMNLSSALVVPILARDVVFGTIQMLRFQPSPSFAIDEVELAHDVARRVGAIFENARLYQRAQAAIAARDQFLSIAAHELRTPVASIKGYAQLLSRSLERGSLTSERLHQALRTMETAVSRLSNLTDDLLGMSLRGGQELPLRHQIIHVPRFLRSIVERSEPLYDHPILLDPGVADVSVLGDVAKLEQVVFNLISNASKYSPPGTSIHISATKDSLGVVVSVTDEGIGLVSGDQERIFQPFGRSDVMETSRIPGLGLGLYICKGIIERHSGRIWAESAGPNLGTSIYILLPIQEDHCR